MGSFVAHLARPVGYESFRSLTPADPTSITPTPDGGVLVTFPDDVTAAQLAAAKRWVESRTDVEASLRDTAIQSLQVNRDYVNKSLPASITTVAQAVAALRVVDAEARALARQNNALIRMVAGRAPRPA